jgi:(4S)-4-hydroxy-5-phosphonooxypentane-2,3-dione isomerase
MYIVHVNIHVKPESVEPFRKATIENARSSVQEAGIARFDFLQNSDDPTRFMLVEVYRTPEAADLHKQTAHYQTWRVTVAEMMAEARTSVKFSNIFPADNSWN